MLNYKLLSILCVLIFPFASLAQDNSRQEIKGKLLPATDNLFLETVYVYNKQSGKGILSDSLGNFKLTLRQGDTIAISAIHTEANELVVEKMHLNDAFITLPVKASNEYLKEVRLSNRSLTGSLSMDMKKLATEEVVTSADLGFPVSPITMTKGERMLGSYSSSPTELLFAALTGELKKVKRRVAADKREGKRQHIIKRMPNKFYTSNLKITDQNISHFIDFCESENDLDSLINMSINDFVEILEKYAMLYKENYPERL